MSWKCIIKYSEIGDSAKQNTLHKECSINNIEKPLSELYTTMSLPIATY